MKILAYILLSSILLYAFSSSADNNSTRYFGGLSENKLFLPQATSYAPIVITKEIFTATNTKEMDAAIDKQELFDIEKKIIAKEFTQKNAGHLFGGISEIKLNLQP